MAKTPDVRARVRTYVAAAPRDSRTMLRALRAMIRDAAPDAIEIFSYGIPGFRLDGKAFLWYAGWREHVSLYPIGAAIRRTHASAMKGLVTSTGTVRFPLTKPLPVSLVRRLIKARMAEMRKAR